MAKVYVINRVGNFQASFRLPAGVNEASEFCQNVLTGKWEIYKFESQQGDPNYTGNYQIARITVRDQDTDEHYRIELWVKPGVTENDIKEAFSTWTGAENVIVQLTPVILEGATTKKGKKGKGKSS